ncbi:hypothetical protein Bca52824_025052 [Brassica carinata]|uniref:Uncharacterized protein n=1 Tax=Brassica carinata TaxID=52824 RepID=A0A8X8AVB9_BRACI|nr:hypothetical protein Bca52824_025052 [Brassica carinata]
MKFEGVGKLNHSYRQCQDVLRRRLAIEEHRSVVTRINNFDPRRRLALRRSTEAADDIFALVVVTRLPRMILVYVNVHRRCFYLRHLRRRLLSETLRSAPPFHSFDFAEGAKL